MPQSQPDPKIDIKTRPDDPRSIDERPAKAPAGEARLKQPQRPRSKG